MKKLNFLLVVTLFFAACRPEVYTPKPRGYFNIPLPEHAYRNFDSSGFPYSFEYPVYSNILANPTFFGEKPQDPFWLNIDFPGIGGKIYLSYKQIDQAHTLANLNEDSYEMSFNAHNKKADYIKDFMFSYDANRVYGIFYNVTGDAASAYQFYATDSVKHFIRGALYFETTPNADSLAPLNEFIKDDIRHMIETLTWK